MLESAEVQTLVQGPEPSGPTRPGHSFWGLVEVTLTWRLP